jgi:catechol 2,3-dioxygenase-like lactoylglutathione lyase family enzyme
VIGAKQVDFVALPVSDLARADDFYGQTLGLARNPNSSSERWVEYETGNLTLALSMFGGGVALRVDDVHEARRTLEQAGVSFQHDEVFDSGVCHVTGFTDPDGNSLILHRRYAPLEHWDPPTTAVQRTDFVAILTPDLERAEEFYEGVLGLPRNPNHSPGWPEFEPGNVALLTTDVAKTGQEFRANGGAVALRVADVAATMEGLRAEGVEFQFDEVYDSGVCHMAFFRDPDGNALMLHHRYAPYRDGSRP